VQGSESLELVRDDLEEGTQLALRAPEILVRERPDGHLPDA
jgi:hypothetical protein